MKPFLKWAGGKRQLLPYIKKYINKKKIGKHKYYEPFLGGGSIFFDLAHENSSINDLNEEIINCYNVIKENPDELVELLKLHAEAHCKEYYYKIRSLDREEDYKFMDNITKAARTIYLNRTCFNGLYRVNKNGFFNTPIGRYVNPLICDEENINEISYFLNNNDVTIMSKSFEFAVEKCEKGDWIYFDPPYDYENSGFVGYVKEGFSHEDLVKLKEVCDELVKKGCYVLVSNNDTEFVRQTFNSSDYEIIYSTKTIKANRNINSKASKRKKVDEVLIYGHKRKKQKNSISSSK